MSQCGSLINEGGHLLNTSNVLMCRRRRYAQGSSAYKSPFALVQAVQFCILAYSGANTLISPSIFKMLSNYTHRALFLVFVLIFSAISAPLAERASYSGDGRR